MNYEKIANEVAGEIRKMEKGNYKENFRKAVRIIFQRHKINGDWSELCQKIGIILSKRSVARRRAIKRSRQQTEFKF